MKDFLLLAICLLTFGLTILPFIKSFDTNKSLKKIFLATALFAGIATFWREEILNEEDDRKDQLISARDSANQLALVLRDEKNKKELLSRDSANREELKAVASVFSDKLILQGSQINKSIPAIGPFFLKTTRDGLTVRYTVYKSIERLKLILISPSIKGNVNDSTDLMYLPTDIGENYILIPFTKVPLGTWATLQIISVNPYLNTAVFEHFNYISSATGNILITADNTFLTTDNGDILISDDSFNIDLMKPSRLIKSH